MKFKIASEEKEEEKTVVLKLIKFGYREVNVVAFAENGETFAGGRLCRFTTEGTILRCMGVSPALGFQLDDKGRIKIED